MNQPNKPMPLLELNGLRVAFGSNEVVKGIDVQLYAGEKLALVGESGSGKTVSALAVLGLLGPARVQGHCWFEGEDLLQATPERLQSVRGQDIAMVFQEPMTALNPLFTMGDQISEVLELKMGLGRAEAWARSAELLALTGLTPPLRILASYPHQLSGGQRQRALIAMALACKPRLLLADEPTTALDVSLRGQILDLLSTLQKQTGMAVILITHDLNMVRRFADKVAVMEGGLVVEHGAVQDILSRPQHPYTRKLVDSQPHKNLLPRQPGASEVLRGEKVRVAYPMALSSWRGWFRKGENVAVQAADFVLRRGETLGVVGESGSGKSSLALAVLGLLPHQGHVQVLGQSWRFNTSADLPLRRAVQVVFQDPFSSLSPRMTVEDVVGEGLMLHHPDLSEQQRQQRILSSLQEVGLGAAEFVGLLQRYPHEFSGGQRQRLAMARALVLDPQVLVLDEPTSALDVSIQKQILELLQKLQKDRGLAYFLITHDMAVIEAMSHHIMVMQGGVVVEHGEAQALLLKPQHPYTQSLLKAWN